jgi:hypothetical protein
MNKEISLRITFLEAIDVTQPRVISIIKAAKPNSLVLVPDSTQILVAQ